MSKEKHETKTATVTFQGKPITVTHLTPILSPEEREKQRREIEQTLYDVFVKYADKRAAGASKELTAEAAPTVSPPEEKT